MEIIIAVIGVIFIFLIFGSKLTGSSSQKNRNEKLDRRFDEEFIALEFNPNSLPISARQVMVDAASRYVQKKINQTPDRYPNKLEAVVELSASYLKSMAATTVLMIDPDGFKGKLPETLKTGIPFISEVLTRNGVAFCAPDILFEKVADRIEGELKNTRNDSSEVVSERSDEVAEIVDFILALIAPQHWMMPEDPPNLPSDDFSIGYVFGFVDENLRSRGISNEDVRAYSIVTIVFGSLFGEEHGGKLFGRVLELNADRSSEVVVGAQQGVKDMRIFLNSEDQGRDGPMGWAAKIMGVVDGRHTRGT